MEKLTSIIKSDIDKLPKTAGVYLFYEKSELIYIGKAINIKERVKNHFFQPNYKDDLYIGRVEKIGFIETGSEIEALVLEANLIKKHLPKFNAVWKDDKNYFYVALRSAQGKPTVNELPYVFITHQKKDNKTTYIGPFIEGAPLKKTLKYLRRVFPFYTSGRHPKTACTWCHLDLCPGPNPNLPEYKKNLKKLGLILQGKRKSALYALRSEMETASRANNFEKAGKIRDRMHALERILEHTHVIESENSKFKIQKWPENDKLLQKILGIKNSVSKIECFDISNIQGKNAVGSMVVFVGGGPAKSQYKKFRIRMKNEPNDIAMLKEVLTRRLNHSEWGYPEIMLIDGGIAQLNVAIKAKNEHIRKSATADFLTRIKSIKIISIAKGRQELFIEGQKNPIPLKDLPQEMYNLIKHLDDEAHRFAISYHRLLRKKKTME